MTTPHSDRSGMTIGRAAAIAWTTALALDMLLLLVTAFS